MPAAAETLHRQVYAGQPAATGRRARMGTSATAVLHLFDQGDCHSGSHTKSHTPVSAASTLDGRARSRGRVPPTWQVCP